MQPLYQAISWQKSTLHWVRKLTYPSFKQNEPKPSQKAGEEASNRLSATREKTSHLFFASNCGRWASKSPSSDSRWAEFAVRAAAIDALTRLRRVALRAEVANRVHDSRTSFAPKGCRLPWQTRIGFVEVFDDLSGYVIAETAAVTLIGKAVGLVGFCFFERECPSAVQVLRTVACLRRPDTSSASR